jgi:purine-binding chemotaxis protein CheW
VLVGEQALFVFLVSGVGLAIPARDIGAVSAVDEPTPIPSAPPHVLGLVAAGERVLPLVDLAQFLDLPGEGSLRVDPLFRRTLFVRSGELEAGLICHRARGLVNAEASALREPTVLQGKGLKPYLTAELETGNGLVGVLDVAALLRAASVP